MSQTRSSSLLNWSHRLAAVVAVAIGGFWLVAWLGGRAAQWSAAGMLTMKTNMALGLCLAGAALLLLGSGGARSLRRWAGAAAAALVLLLGTLTLSEHLFGYDLGIDQILATEPPGAYATTSPNRFGLPGSLSLTALGAGLLALAWGRWNIVPYLGLAVCLIVLVPATGFLYEITAFYGQPRITGIAWPTVIALLALGVGLVLVHRDSGPMVQLLRDDAGGMLLRRMLPVTVSIPLVLVFLRVLGERQGLYHSATGRGMLAIALISVFSALLWRTASQLSRSAAAQQESEASFQAVFESSSTAVALAAPDKGFMKVNPVFCRMLGFSESELLGRSFADITHPDDLAASLAVVEKLVKGEESSFRLEKRYIRKDGSIRWGDISTTLVRDPQGKMHHFVNLIQDITERKQAEAELRQIREDLDRAQAVGQIGSWRLDIGRNTLNWSDETYRIFGLPLGTPMNYEKFLDAVHSDDREGLDAKWKAALRGEPYELEHRILAGGQVKWVREKAYLELDGAGRLLGGFGIVQDITDRKHIEQALTRHREELEVAVREAVAAVERANESLHRQGELLRTVFDNIPVMLTMFDSAGNVLLWNRELEKKSGWSREEVQRINVMEAVYPDPEYRRSVMDFILRAEPGVWQDQTMTMRDGSKLESSWSNVRLSDGRRIGIGIDITERKSIEAQLREAQKMEAVGRLAGGIAHDFNNLMTVVGGYSARLLKQIPRQSPVYVEVEQVKMAGERATELTRQLLAFSRKQVLRPETLSLDAAVAEMIPMLERLLGEDVRVLQTCALEPQWVRVDRNQLVQVIMNLAVNSRDAMPKGGTLTFAVDEGELNDADAGRLDVIPGRYSTLTVTDTGSGMPPEVRSHLFEPFFTTKPAGQGTGLGLAMVLGIVKQSGGGIEVWSEPDKGSRFTIYLLKQEPPEPANAEPKAQEEPARAAQGETILVVEDEESILALMRANLEDLGYQVLTAQNLAQAEAALAGSGEEVRLLLTDVVLTEESGPEVYETLARLRPGLKVLYMSGHDRGHVVQRGILAPDTAFIEKPFTMESLAAKMKEALGSKPRA